jgi:hypothetical protein
MKPTTSGDSCRPAFLSHYEFLDAPIDRFGEFFANDITPDRDRSAFIVDRSPTFSIASENLPDLVETPTESEPDRQPELSRTETLESFVVSGARPRPGTGGLFQMTSKTDNPIADPVKLDVGGIFGANPPENHSALCSCVACALPAVRKPGGNDGPEIQGTPSTFSLALAAPPLDLSRTFFLNSLSGANHTIYLDFTGHTTTGTFWNTSARPTITTPAFDLDGNTAFFSAVEQERIQYIWQRVAEDFSPFNVNVTTQSPTNSGDLINSGAGDTRWGVRVAIGGSSSDWFGGGAGGVAYVNSFNWNTDTPAFVFTSNLANDEKYIAEAISHEAGHTLGLGHDGRISPSEGYYGGQGSGETGWGTIMGVGYYRNLTQWSRGQYNSANNTEDDLAIITTRNGFGYRVDDTGNSIAAARALTVSGTTVSGSGIIERNTDVDFFSFTTGAGAINLTVNPFSRGPNLDILAQLYNSSGVLVASSNPTDFLSATISTTLNAGTYYLAIDGVGKGDPLTTGYTDYGSLGQYFIGGNVIAPSGGDAAAVSFALSASTVTEDGTANLLYTFTRNGSLANPLTVNYTVGGTATNGTDYTAIGTSVTFAAGASTATVTIDPTADTLLESDETVALTLASGTGYSIATPGAVTGTIANDDYRPIESNGNTALLLDGADRFYTRTGANAPVAIRFQGQPLTVNYFAGWETLAAENLNGTNRVLWRNASQNVVHLWTTDANWNWVSSDGTWGLNSSDAWARENEFGVDVNNDGGIGAPSVGTEANDTLIGNGIANFLDGRGGNDLLTGGGDKDRLTGGTESDRFDYRVLTDSLIANFDAVTDFTATAGNDLFLVSSARSTFTDAGTAATLDASGIGAILTAGTFTANAAARFSFGSRTFAAINDATAGFNAATDAVIEVTGITGTLSLSNFTTV